MTSYGSPIHEVRLTMRHLPLLQMQRGKINNLRHEPLSWAQAYRQDLQREFELLRPWLPQPCKKMLDVGSGMGGLDILIQRYYNWGRGGCESWLLDGSVCTDIDPELEHDHDMPFNDAQLTFDFWRMNAVKVPVYVPADNPVIPPDVFFDLIISTQSWCFHYAPSTYLSLVNAHSHDRTWLMVDVRKRGDWLHELAKHWTVDKVLIETEKYVRLLCHPLRVIGR